MIQDFTKIIHENLIPGNNFNGVPIITQTMLKDRDIFTVHYFFNGKHTKTLINIYVRQREITLSSHDENIKIIGFPIILIISN